ncbi:MAG: exodeoxyribonuclease V subunit gamma, partial [Nannocystaceae bacterium]|nr:exodeoxyribonuclease V subunit gamma [Nannocystaceae bacterium]
MKVHRSNRVEALLSTLVDIIAEPAAGPFVPEPIVVHSRAMAVWLTQRLAENFGGWSRPHFPFPRRFIEDAMAAVLGPKLAEQAGAWSRSRLSWAIEAELPGKLDDPRYQPLTRYLSHDPRPHAVHGLAEQIADVFDQYLVFRPDVVLGWQQGAEGDWQADLWRALTARLGETNLATLSVKLSNALVGPRARDPLHATFGSRVCIFGISTLPPLLLQLLDRLSRHLEVHLLLASPSREYWAEIRSHRETLRAARREANAPQDLLYSSESDGNPLLASFGAVGRDFQRVLEGEVNYEENPADLYVEPIANHALAQLQTDVLYMRRRGTPEFPPVVLQPSDDSITIHACHSPMREVEVLHDQLLALLSGPNAPAPHNVVVLMTDVETYAPLVEAVFERERSDPGWVPYCVADTTARSESPVVEAFHRILEMVGGRVTASEVLDLLALSAVQARFDLSPDDVDRISQWVTETGIRWGIDGRHRASHGQPRYEENTWRFGLQRLLLGFAMRGHDRDTFAGVLPYDEVEGSQTAVLGKLARLCDELFDRVLRLAAPRTPQAWRTDLSSLLDTLIDAEGEAAYDHQRLRRAIDAAVADAAAVDFTGTVDGESVRGHVESQLADDHASRGFLSGGVTFCAMLPMRSLPFSTVCLLGMSDGAFPRPTRRVGFDLIGQRSRPGDRSRRSEDRYLFLESLLMARDRVILTYVGQSIIDNASRPPSVALAELLDVLRESFVVPQHHTDQHHTDPQHADADPLQVHLDVRGAAVEARIVLRHPMQPFSPQYFGASDDARLFSYAEPYLQGAMAVATGRKAGSSVPLLTGPLPAEPGPREVGLPQLIRFFQRPAEQLLKQRLALYLRDEPRQHADREPIELDALESWRAGDAILAHRLAGIDGERSRELLRAAGQLPLGTPGAVRWDELRAAADPIAAIVTAVRQGEVREPLPVDLVVDGTRIVGRLPRRWAAGMILHQYSRVAPKTKIGTWIQHLVLGCIAPPDSAHITCIVGRSPQGEGTHVVQFPPIEA